MLLVFHVCHAVLSVTSSLVVICWERANHLALFYVMFSCVFVTFQYGVLGRVWYLIILIPDPCLLPYFYYISIVVILPLWKDKRNVINSCQRKCTLFTIQ